MLQVPAQQHGMVLVLGVVAVLHIGPGELPETGGHFDAGTTLILGADPEHLLACPFFPFRRCLAVPPEDNRFLEVDMHRMAPAAAVNQVPDLQRPFPAGAGLGWAGGKLWRSRDPPGIR